MNEPTSIGVVADYNLLERLEPAGPGDLYRARDTRHGRTVIVRVLPPASQSEDETWLRQAQSLATLSHQNAIKVYESGIHDGRVYVGFEHVKGQSLRAEMAGRQMNARRAVELAIGIADAVAEAHALGFLHAGLSPDAIAITAKGHSKVAASHLGTTLGFVGSGDDARLIDYESPEEGRGEPADERSDVYSIGAVLYEMLTTRRPMPRGASAPGAANRMVTKELDAAVLKAISPNPERRHQSAAELAAALRAVVPGLQLPDVPPDLGAAAAPASGAGRVLLITLAILAALGAIVWWLTRS
jgi:serine/threonine-protein kinase